jgi:hypothetical protein
LTNARRVAESPFCHLHAEAKRKHRKDVKSGKAGKKSSESLKQAAVEAWHALDDFSRSSYFEKACGGSAPDPVVADFCPSRHFGAITERLDALIESYVKNNGLEEEEANLFRDRLKLKAMESQVSFYSLIESPDIYFFIHDLLPSTSGYY